MIIENVLGTFEVDEDRRTLKALSLVEDKLLNKFISLQYRFWRHDYLPQYVYMPLETHNEVFDWRTMLINALKEGTSFPYTKDKSRYSLVLDNILPLPRSSKSTRKKPYPVNRALSMWDGKSSCVYLLPLDFITMRDVLADNDFTSANGTDIVSFAQFLNLNAVSPNSNSNLSNFEITMPTSGQVVIDPMLVMKALEEIDYYKNRVEKLIEEFSDYRSKQDEEMRRLKEKTAADNETIKELNHHIEKLTYGVCKKNKTHRLKQIVPPWHENNLRKLYAKLVEKGLVSQTTKEDDFLYVFGCGDDRPEFVKVTWIARTPKNKPSFVSLLDLLQRMGYDERILAEHLNNTFRLPENSNWENYALDRITDPFVKEGMSNEKDKFPPFKPQHLYNHGHLKKEIKEEKSSIIIEIIEGIKKNSKFS